LICRFYSLFFSERNFNLFKTTANNRSAGKKGLQAEKA